LTPAEQAMERVCECQSNTLGSLLGVLIMLCWYLGLKIIYIFFSGTNGAKDELDLLLSSQARPGVDLSQNGHWRK